MLRKHTPTQTYFPVSQVALELQKQAQQAEDYRATSIRQFVRLPVYKCDNNIFQEDNDVDTDIIFALVVFQSLNKKYINLTPTKLLENIYQVFHIYSIFFT